MVPVSSTVIPVTNPFASIRRDSDARNVRPFSYSSAYARKLRFFEKSSKPKTPGKLITKRMLSVR
jgi:hypothetical protein